MGQVNKSVAEVIKSIAKDGLEKKKKNQYYQYRGIDDLLNMLSPKLASNSLMIVPEYYDYVSRKEGKIYHVSLSVNLNIRSLIDDSFIKITGVGEAFDNSDKATYKAMSMAYKYLLIQAFCIPVEGNPDEEEGVISNKITREEALSLVEAVTTKGIDKDEFLKAIGVKRTSDILSKDLSAARKWINDRD